MQPEGRAAANRMTIGLPHDLHRKLKVLAAERDITMQALLEAELRTILERGHGQPARGSQDTTLRIPPHLEPVVERFVEFWQHPKNRAEREILKLIEVVMGLSDEKGQ